MNSPPRQTTDPMPLPSSPANTDTLVPARKGSGGDAAAGASGIPFAGQAGVAQADADAADRRDAAGVRPASADDTAASSTTAADSNATAGASTSHPATPADAAAADGPPAHVDGLLESIGKAISSPIRGAAEDEEPA